MNTKTAKNIKIIDFLNILGCQPDKIVHNNYYYKSPLRMETTASLKVDTRLNLWYDHGSAKGGTIIDLVIAMDKARTISEALNFLKNLNLNFVVVHDDSKRENIKNQIAINESVIRIENIQAIQDSNLLQYLQNRKINTDIAKYYLQEIHYSVKDKNYKALSWQNNKGGHHFRSEHFKGCTSQGITIIPSSNSKNEKNICMIYEGMFDFLSHLTLKDTKEFKVDCIILNSLSNMNKTINWVKENQLTPSLMLDNDMAGQKATKKFLEFFPAAKDFSIVYSNHKDLNDYLKSEKNLKNNLDNVIDENINPEQTNSYKRKR